MLHRNAGFSLEGEGETAALRTRSGGTWIFAREEEVEKPVRRKTASDSRAKTTDL